MGQKRYKIVLIQPPDFLHTGVFTEVALLLQASLLSLGHSAEIGVNDPRPDVMNILLGYHLLAPEPGWKKLPFIIYQLEPLTSSNHWFNPIWLDMLSMARAIWDISPLNINFLQSRGIANAKYLPLGYHPSLATIKPAAEDIDVLFYGSMNPRRGKVMDDLKHRCQLGHLFGSYGPPRDAIIARSKIILNLHQLDESPFEQVRVSYLLNNSRFILSEPSTDNPYADLVPTAPYDQIAATCLQYLADPARRAQLTQSAGERFKTMRMEDLLKNVLD